MCSRCSGWLEHPISPRSATLSSWSSHLHGDKYKYSWILIRSTRSRSRVAPRLPFYVPSNKELCTGGVTHSLRVRTWDAVDAKQRRDEKNGKGFLSLWQWHCTICSALQLKLLSKFESILLATPATLRLRRRRRMSRGMHYHHHSTRVNYSTPLRPEMNNCGSDRGTNIDSSVGCVKRDKSFLNCNSWTICGGQNNAPTEQLK